MRPQPAIESLRAQIERIHGRSRRTKSALPFGIAEVDSRLPGGGLAFGALHEIAGGGNGAIDGAAAALFSAGVAARTKGKILWASRGPTCSRRRSLRPGSRPTGSSMSRPATTKPCSPAWRRGFGTVGLARSWARLRGSR